MFCSIQPIGNCKNLNLSLSLLIHHPFCYVRLSSCSQPELLCMHTSSKPCWWVLDVYIYRLRSGDTFFVLCCSSNCFCIFQLPFAKFPPYFLPAGFTYFTFISTNFSRQNTIEELVRLLAGIHTALIENRGKAPYP